MQYKCIAESSNVKIFERDKFYENTWHCVAKIDHGNLRFSKLTDSEQQKEINLFVVYHNLSRRNSIPA